ncbi:MAG: DUF1003 domain-containing protein [Lachnospiraceae bacterium]|nr:DUF1003 domain-containing protein [Lachnospiraceae bacterium]
MEVKKNEREKLLRELLKTTDDELGDEELLHMLISQKLSTTPDDYSNSTFGQRAADTVAKFVGSWAFIFIFIGIIFLWMLTNILMATNAFDPYPFILLNLVLSCVAAIQAPLIMMSQNRQEAKDRERAESDYHVNLKSELIVGDLHVKLDSILDNQKKLQQELKAIRNEIKK